MAQRLSAFLATSRSGNERSPTQRYRHQDDAPSFDTPLSPPTRGGRSGRTNHVRINRMIAAGAASIALVAAGIAAPSVSGANAAGSLESYETTVGADSATVYYRVPDAGESLP